MNEFEVIPAIDLLGGRCVRLEQGRYAAATVYAEDPAAAAREFARHSIRRLHVVDLDGARAGVPKNIEAVRGVVAAAAGVSVQLGGGLRSLAAIEASLALGVERVVLGTVALRDPALTREAAALFPGRVAVGIDARDGCVAVAGWVEATSVRAADLAKRFEDAGVAALIHTDIARDGMQGGPNWEASVELAQQVSIPVIVSGGVGSLEDIQRVAKLAASGLAGVIVGRALYTGTVELGRALEIAKCC